MPEQVPEEQVTPEGVLVIVPFPVTETDKTIPLVPVMVFETSGAGVLSFPEVS